MTEEDPRDGFDDRETFRKHDPCEPSEREKIDHEMAHLFLRKWCGHCIKGIGREEESRVIEIHLHCMFTGNEKEGKTWAFLFAREKVTKAVLSIVVPRKSTGSVHEKSEWSSWTSS